MSTELATTGRTSYRGIVAAILCISVFAVALSVTYPLITLLLERQGISAFWIGVNNAMPPIGMLITGALAPRLMARIGVSTFCLICVLGTSVCLLGFKLWDNYGWWTFLRFALGLFNGGLFLGTEFWVVTQSPPAIRGRIVALYALVLSLGLYAGPEILNRVGIDGWAPFLAAVAVAFSAIIPLAAAWRASPVIQVERGHKTLSFFLTDPSVLWAVVLFGVVEFGVFGLMPVWGVRIGLAESAAIALV
ncbi:MAG: MFS transporter, partial [Pseudomonadota bacterium]